MTKTITSVQNPFIKQLLNLKDKSRTRKKTGLFVIEGKRELSLAIKGKYTIETLYYYPDLFSESEAKSLSLYNIDVIEINKTVYEKIAHRGTTEGIIAVARCKDFKLDKTQKINASVLYPHQVIKHLGVDVLLAEKFWENLPNFIKENNFNDDDLFLIQDKKQISYGFTIHYFVKDYSDLQSALNESGNN